MGYDFGVQSGICIRNLKLFGNSKYHGLLLRLQEGKLDICIDFYRFILCSPNPFFLFWVITHR